MIDRPAFLRALAEELGRPAEVIRPQEPILDPGELDSLVVVSLLVWVEDLAGACDPTVDGLPGDTAADLYAHYRRLAAAPRAGRSPGGAPS